MRSEQVQDNQPPWHPLSAGRQLASDLEDNGGDAYSEASDAENSAYKSAVYRYFTQVSREIRQDKAGSRGSALPRGDLTTSGSESEPAPEVEVGALERLH